jgi:enolase
MSCIALDADEHRVFRREEEALHPESTGDVMTSDDMVALWRDWCKRYPIVSIEDGLAETIGTVGRSHRGARPKGSSSSANDLFVTNTSARGEGIETRDRQLDP